MESCWTSWMVSLMAFCRFARRFLARLCRGLLQWNVAGLLGWFLLWHFAKLA